ncbi:MAG: hypothetical protein COA47_10320 [Robiginitomaculum sp.]|nr:MAG: hypothetical protein COA47_10320 [Robiginitomaculum sp.]
MNIMILFITLLVVAGLWLCVLADRRDFQRMVDKLQPPTYPNDHRFTTWHGKDVVLVTENGRWVKFKGVK